MAASPTDPRGVLRPRLLDRLRADALDCLQANLAVVGDLHHGPGRHLALGARLRFDAVDGDGPSPHAAPSLDQRLVEARELLGLRAARRWNGVDGPGLRELCREHGLLYVVADAYAMEWVPYAGRAHMQHSFLLVRCEPACVIVDAYRNSTQWGAAEPGAWELSAAELDACAVPACAIALVADDPPALDPTRIVDDNARHLDAAVPSIERYVEAVHRHRADPDAITRMVLDVWLLGRSRALHAAWLGTTELPSTAAAAAAESWLQLTSQSYVAMRRVQRGASLPDAVVDELDRLLHADVALARRLAQVAAEPALHAGLRAAVVDEVAAVLGVAAGELEPERALREVPGFDSFRLVDVIERVEARLGLEVEPAALTAQSLRSIDSLCAMFAGGACEAARP